MKPDAVKRIVAVHIKDRHSAAAEQYSDGEGHRHGPVRDGGRFSLVAVPILSTAFGYIGGNVIDQRIGMAAFGLIWGIAAMRVAPRLARLGARSAGHANAPVYIMLPLACMALGGSILGHLAGPTPSGFLQLVQHDGYTLFFYALHGPFEWLLMPWALMVNWAEPRRRRLLVITATIFYAGRVTSALYFAPAALDWGDHPAEAAAEIDQVALWVHLDLVRVAVQDAVIAALLLPAALHREFSRNDAPPRGRAMD